MIVGWGFGWFGMKDQYFWDFLIFWWGILNYIMGEAEGSVFGKDSLAIWCAVSIIDSGHFWSTATREALALAFVHGYGAPQYFVWGGMALPRSMSGYGSFVLGYGAPQSCARSYRERFAFGALVICHFTRCWKEEEWRKRKNKCCQHTPAQFIVK